jgi:hypothetical protein
MENAVHQPPLVNDKSKMEIDNIYLLFTNLSENKKLLKSFQRFTTTYYEIINGYYGQLTELNCHFLVEDKYKSSFIQTPMFQLGKALKNIVQVQIDNLFSIITDDNIFDGFNNSLSSLSNILQETESKFNKKIIEKQAVSITTPLNEKYQNLELKVIDNYISKKYNKHAAGLTKGSLEEDLDQAKYLEASFLDFEKVCRNQVIQYLKEMENKTTNVFNQMKKTIETIIDTLKKKWNGFLGIMEKEEKSIKNTELTYNNKKKSQNRTEEKSKQMEEEILQKIINLDKFKYKIKLIDEPTIKIEDESNKKNKEKKEAKKKEEDKENKGKDELYENPNELTLAEEDIFDIISTLYNYNFKMISKKEYDLNKEKEKLEIKRLTEKILPSKNDINESITDEEVNKLYELLKIRNNLMKFYILLNNYRATGKCNIEERSFEIIKNIFFICLDYLLNNNDKDLEGLIIILSQTFYIIKDNKKIYLQEKIKTHSLFKKREFWKNHLNNMIKEEIDKIEKNQEEGIMVYTKEIKQKKIRELVITKLVPFASYMKEFDNSKEYILNIINPFIEKYELDENSKMMILSILDN